MFALLLVAFLLVPIAEIVVFTRVAASIGLGVTLLLIVTISFVGAWLVKREGMTAFRRANERLARGEVPTDELVNGLLILLGGAFMLTPGFLTDAVGLLALFPPTRAIARHQLKAKFTANTVTIGFGRGGFDPGAFGRGGFGPGGSGSDSTDPDVWDVDGWENPPDRPELP